MGEDRAGGIGFYEAEIDRPKGRPPYRRVLTATVALILCAAAVGTLVARNTGERSLENLSSEDAAALVRDAREATLEAGTARIWSESRTIATGAPSIEPSPGSRRVLEGVVDFEDARASVRHDVLIDGAEFDIPEWEARYVDGAVYTEHSRGSAIAAISGSGGGSDPGGAHQIDERVARISGAQQVVPAPPPSAVPTTAPPGEVPPAPATPTVAGLLGEALESTLEDGPSAQDGALPPGTSPAASPPPDAPPPDALPPDALPPDAPPPDAPPPPEVPAPAASPAPPLAPPVAVAATLMPVDPTKRWTRSALSEGGHPADILDALEKLDEVRQVGVEEVRSVATAHLEGRAELPEASMFFPSSSALFGSAAAPSVPLGVWVDGDGRVRRISISVEVPSPRISGAPAVVEEQVTVEFHHFGVQVDVEPPPAEEVAGPMVAPEGVQVAPSGAAVKPPE